MRLQDGIGVVRRVEGGTVACVTKWLTWRESMECALYGSDGFYRREGPGPAGHFRTSVHNPLFAAAVAQLLLRVDKLLGQRHRLDFVDVGSGRGELVEAVTALLRERAPEVAERLWTSAVEVAPRPPDLSARVVWRHSIPGGINGLLIANEWLDNVVFDVAEVAPDGAARIVEVDPESGGERLGRAPSAEEAEWLTAWWPLTGREPGTRAEIGLDRDRAWRDAVSSVEHGWAVAIDYAHIRGTRPPFGTMTGYREGRQVEPVADGTCDVTAHVALDACAAVRPSDCTEVLPQRTALHSLGMSGARPPLNLARTDPSAYIRALSAASSAAELTDGAGLGAFTWLVQSSGLATRRNLFPVPGPLA